MIRCVKTKGPASAGPSLFYSVLTYLATGAVEGAVVVVLVVAVEVVNGAPINNEDGNGENQSLGNIVLGIAEY